MALDIKVQNRLFEILRGCSLLITAGSSLVLTENSNCPEETLVHGDKRLKQHLSLKGQDA